MPQDGEYELRLSFTSESSWPTCTPSSCQGAGRDGGSSFCSGILKFPLCSRELNHLSSLVLPCLGSKPLFLPSPAVTGTSGRHGDPSHQTTLRPRFKDPPATGLHVHLTLKSRDLIARARFHIHTVP